MLLASPLKSHCSALCKSISIPIRISAPARMFRLGFHTAAQTFTPAIFHSTRD
jgi:hypothetical protein